MDVGSVGGGLPVDVYDLRQDQQNQEWAAGFNNENQGTGYSVDYNNAKNEFTFTLPNGEQTDPMSREEAEKFETIVVSMDELDAQDPAAVNEWIEHFESRE